MEKRHLITALALCTAVGANAAVMFTEDFSDGLAQNLEYNQPGMTPNGDNIVMNGTDLEWAWSGIGDDRQYIRTVDSDYNTVDFTLQATLTVANEGWWSAMWFGMGIGTYSSNFQEPNNPALGGELTGANADGANFNYWDNGYGNGQEGWGKAGAGTHRVQMVWDATLQQATVSIDSFSDASSGAFVADGTFVLDGSNNGLDASNSHIYFASGDGSRMDDITVIPEPATLGMVALLGGSIIWIRKWFII